MHKDKLDLILEQWAAEKPGLDCAPMAVIGRALRLATHLDRELSKVFAQLGLPPGGFDVLATLLRSGPPYQLSPNDLLRWMLVTSGTMTNRLDQLEKAGWVERKPNPADGRGVLVALTTAGRQMAERALAAHLDNERRLLAGLTAAQQEQLADLLRLWMRNFET
ncbi:MAG: MarR family transcriptional regulator [Magnetospirillum gryphiswaldense]|nr:MarR family transcriptional regulator [Magnetospirillum gryphiswaldense]